jgi:transcriptional regulator with XRE-family HTH domain
MNNKIKTDSGSDSSRALLTLGQMCREARKYRAMTQNRLSSRINVSSKFISLLELGQRGVSFPTLARIMTVLQFNIVFMPAEFKPQVAKNLIKTLQPMLPHLREIVRILEQLEGSVSNGFPTRT